MRRFVPTLILVCAGAPALVTAQLTTPTDWKWRQDTAAPLASGAKMEPGSWVFVQMPPGWHVTTGPGVLLYPSTHGDVGGNFSLEAEIFLFSGESAEEYGVFLGGQDIEGAATPDYSAFVLRRDGQAAVLRRRAGQTTPVSNWQRHESILPGKAGDEPVKNVLRIDIDQSNATLSVNGAQGARRATSRGPHRWPNRLPGGQRHEPPHHDAQRHAEARAGAGQEGIARCRSWFGVRGSGFGVRGFWVRGSGFGVLGSGFGGSRVAALTNHEP